MKRNVMDWRAAVLAGILAGIIFWLVLFVVFWTVTDMSPWLIPQLIGALILGPGALNPIDVVNPLAVVVGTVLHLILSILFAGLIAFIFHRWGIIVGILGGALVGAVLYFINYHGLAMAFPWLAALQGWPMLLGHVLYGALTGGLYEFLELDEDDVVEAQPTEEETAVPLAPRPRER